MLRGRGGKCALLCYLNRDLEEAEAFALDAPLGLTSMGDIWLKALRAQIRAARGGPDALMEVLAVEEWLEGVDSSWTSGRGCWADLAREWPPGIGQEDQGFQSVGRSIRQARAIVSGARAELQREIQEAALWYEESAMQAELEGLWFKTLQAREAQARLAEAFCIPGCAFMRARAEALRSTLELPHPARSI